jgi:8-oxo-dGTP diphosphatase
MTLYLVRHGQAGHRSAAPELDSDRPLSPRGEAEAIGVAKFLGSRPIGRILSSPFRRCRQTVEPLAGVLGLPVEPTPALDERADDAEILSLVAGLTGVDAALCTHGNIVPVVLDHLRRNGTHFGPGPHDWKKGSVWVLETDGRGAFTQARYVPPVRG